MALAYAFIDEQGVRHGEENPAPPVRIFEFVPDTGPFAGQRLVIHASPWEGGVSNTWLKAEGRSVNATDWVEEILGMPRPVNAND